VLAHQDWAVVRAPESSPLVTVPWSSLVVAVPDDWSPAALAFELVLAAACVPIEPEWAITAQARAKDAQAAAITRRRISATRRARAARRSCGVGAGMRAMFGALRKNRMKGS
jgi:hypothetical protein